MWPFLAPPQRAWLILAYSTKLSYLFQEDFLDSLQAVPEPLPLYSLSVLCCIVVMASLFPRV